MFRQYPGGVGVDLDLPTHLHTAPLQAQFQATDACEQTADGQGHGGASRQASAATPRSTIGPTDPVSALQHAGEQNTRTPSLPA